MEINPIRGQSAPIASVPVLAPEQAAEQRQLIRAVKALNATELFGSNRELSFKLDPHSRRPVIRIVDRKTKEVVQQIPAEHVLRAARDIA